MSIGESTSVIINKNIVHMYIQQCIGYICHLHKYILYYIQLRFFLEIKKFLKLSRYLLKSKGFFSACILVDFFSIWFVYVLLPFLAYIRTCQNSKHQWLTNNDVGVRSFDLKFVSAWPWPKTWKIKQFYFLKDCISKILIRWSSYFEKPNKKKYIRNKH